jgi:hypothetical protein
MSVLDKLTEGIVNRDLQKEGAALLNKWEKTGLLEGLNSDRAKDGMARMLENQAKELLREASTMAGGDVEGFAAVAFPIVRRVFGSLIANDLVSVQPMSLPSGLIFFLDFTVNGDIPSPAKPGYPDDSSLYGGGVVASQLTGGVSLTGDNLERGPYSLNNGFSSPTGSELIDVSANPLFLVASGTVGAAAQSTGDYAISAADQNTLNKLCRFDPDLSGSQVAVFEMTGTSDLAQMDLRNLVALGTLDSTVAGEGILGGRLVRRLTEVSTGSVGDDPELAIFKLKLVFEATGSQVLGNGVDTPIDGTNLLHCVTGADFSLSFPIDDNFNASNAIGSVVGASEWQLENQQAIPEIDIKVDSVAVTAQTKKLKAKWTPELGQDLNAYHNLDAEVELTSILSEQIALEIDREILEDLIKGATAGTQYWSRRPGKFVTRDTGAPIVGGTANEELLGADFTGTVSEWYETLAETINDVSAQIHRKTLRGGANFVVCSPEVANILEFTAGFRASVTHDADRGTIGAVNVGSLSKKFDVYVDPYFPRNVVLVGRKGGSFLESGYVYAPYVPLQVTPTIFGVEDFVPRKGVMTRYAKKMVRPDMYGLVICQDLLG